MLNKILRLLLFVLAILGDNANSGNLRANYSFICPAKIYVVDNFGIDRQKYVVSSSLEDKGVSYTMTQVDSFGDDLSLNDSDKYYFVHIVYDTTISVADAVTNHMKEITKSGGQYLIVDDITTLQNDAKGVFMFFAIDRGIYDFYIENGLSFFNSSEIVVYEYDNDDESDDESEDQGYFSGIDLAKLYDDIIRKFKDVFQDLGISFFKNPLLNTLLGVSFFAAWVIAIVRFVAYQDSRYFNVYIAIGMSFGFLVIVNLFRIIREDESLIVFIYDLSESLYKSLFNFITIGIENDNKVSFDKIMKIDRFWDEFDGSMWVYVIFVLAILSFRQSLYDAAKLSLYGVLLLFVLLIVMIWASYEKLYVCLMIALYYSLYIQYYINVIGIFATIALFPISLSTYFFPTFNSLFEKNIRIFVYLLLHLPLSCLMFIVFSDFVYNNLIDVATVGWSSWGVFLVLLVSYVLLTALEDIKSTFSSYIIDSNVSLSSSASYAASSIGSEVVSTLSRDAQNFSAHAHVYKNAAPGALDKATGAIRDGADYVTKPMRDEMYSWYDGSSVQRGVNYIPNQYNKAKEYVSERYNHASRAMQKDKDAFNKKAKELYKSMPSMPKWSDRKGVENAEVEGGKVGKENSDNNTGDIGKEGANKNDKK